MDTPVLSCQNLCLKTNMMMNRDIKDEDLSYPKCPCEGCDSVFGCSVCWRGIHVSMTCDSTRRGHIYYHSSFAS